MKIRTVDTSESDRSSARLFFEALAGYYDLSDAHALDMFARNGQLTVARYAHLVAELDLWELNPEHQFDLMRYVTPNGEVKIGDSYKTMLETSRKYSMVVIDTPQGIHENWLGEHMIEHFGVMKQIGRVLRREALIVLYVNKEPYNRSLLGSHGYDEYDAYDFDEWMLGRELFYGTAFPEKITEEQAIQSYRQVLAAQGFEVRSMLVVPCHSDVPGKRPYAFRLCLEVGRGGT